MTPPCNHEVCHSIKIGRCGLENGWKTPEGIEFNYWLSGPDGAHYELYPEKGTHNDDQIKAAKKWLKANFDVVGRIEVNWK